MFEFFGKKKAPPGKDLDSARTTPSPDIFRKDLELGGEKNAPDADHAPNLDQVGETQGYVLDADKYGDQASKLKLASDGKTVLIPQPSDNADDPLNWSQSRKNTILIVITCVSFLSDYTSSQGIAALVPQVPYWGLPANTIQHNLVGNIFCLAAGGLIAVALASFFGRLPVIIAYQILTLGFGIWCGATSNFNSYLAARILQGLTATVGISSGLMWIKDLYFFHEHPRKINWWSLGIIASPYVGPMVASFILWRRPWQWVFWVLTLLNGVCLILSLVFLDETFYNRDVPDPRPYKGNRLQRILGIEQWRNRSTRGSFLQCMARPVIAFSRIPLAALVIYYFLNFAWVIAVNATVSIYLTAQYGFGERELGIFYIAGIIGVLIGWFAGHWMHDMVGRAYARRHDGHIEPEARLWVTHPASALMFVSVLILGYAFERHWHYMVVAVMFAIQILGIMIATVGIDAYLLDAYPEGSGEIGAWTNFGRACGGFMSTYISLNWVAQAGPIVSFGIQSAIVVASVFIIIFVQIWGRRIRRWQGPMRFSTS